MNVFKAVFCERIRPVVLSILFDNCCLSEIWNASNNDFQCKPTQVLALKLLFMIVHYLVGLILNDLLFKLTVKHFKRRKSSKFH